MRQRYRLPITLFILLLTLGSTLLERRTGSVKSRADYLQEFPLPFRDWVETRQELTPHERSLLLPDAVLLRQYRSSDGEAAELAILAGHRKQTVHTPAFCMAGSGWQTITKNDVPLLIDGMPITATRLLMENQDKSIIVTYFFTNGYHSHQSLVRFQMEQYLDRIRGKVPLGALVRIIIPVQKTRSDAEILSNEFSKTVLPGLMAQLRHAQDIQ